MRLKAAREQRGLSQQTVANLVGLCQSEISKLELGRRQLSVRLAVKLAPVLGVQPFDLLQGEIRRQSTRSAETPTG